MEGIDIQAIVRQAMQEFANSGTGQERAGASRRSYWRNASGGNNWNAG